MTSDSALSSFLPALLVLLIAYVVGYGISKCGLVPIERGRYVAIDGLRGFLALGVFASHASIWFNFVREQRWSAPPSELYNNLGQGSVALFFMVTGFLFFGKLLQARGRGFDWTRLYISRVLRLTPMYLVAVALLFSAVAIMTRCTLRESPVRLAISVAKWLTFTLVSAPELNGLNGTSVIVAGVFWTLPYEWLFYMLLPAIGVAVRVRTSVQVMTVTGLALVCVFYTHRARPLVWIMFVGGIVAVAAMKSRDWTRFAQTRWASLLAVGCLAAAFNLFESPWGLPQFLLLTLFFCTVAAGNSVFGILQSAAARTIGEITYSVYLLHGLLLFCVFTFAVGRDRASSLSPLQHWSVVFALTPLLILTSAITYTFIERPFITLTPALTAHVHRIGQKVRMMVTRAMIRN